MEVYFENNIDMYETLAKDYIEYMVDISINEVSVHWCGHSEHAVRGYPEFQRFAGDVVGETKELYEFLREVIDRSVPKEVRLNIFREVVKEDITFSDGRMFKPCIIRQIIDMVNREIKKEVKEISEYSVFEEEGFNKHKITFDFNEKDGILGYFNTKN